MLDYLLGFLILLSVISYYTIIKPHNFWRDRGIECEKPQFILGHWGPVIFLKCCSAVLLKRFYDAYPDKRCIALYQFLSPILIIKDPELIKQITVQEFESFPTRVNYISENDDPVGAKNLFFLTDVKDWKDIRSTLSPAFTRNKLMIMFDLLVDCAQRLTDNFNQDETTVFEAKDTFSKIANDIVATTAFGVDCNTMKNPNNELYLMGKIILYGSEFLNHLKFLMFFISPYLTKIFKVHLVNKKISKYFCNIVRQIINFREENGVRRPDMMQLLMDARKEKFKITNNEDSENKSSVLTDEIIAAQCLIFYFGGFDTLSSSISFLVYELGLNPGVQDKLFSEILNTFQNCDGKITYEALLDMKYLDMVVSEGLRKWPAGSLLDRKPKKAFDLTIEEGKILTVDETVFCYIPVYAIHRDPKYWPNPENFDPERFNDENKRNIKSFTYLPFGVGPKSCIAKRFALLSEKTIIVHLLHKFEIIPVEKTTIPLSLYPGDFQDLIGAHEYWLGLRPRKMV